MRSRTGLNVDGFQSEEREQRLKRFIGRYLEGTDDGRLDAVLMIARSAESPVTRAVVATAADLSARGLKARIILGSQDYPHEAATDALVREVRVIRDPRLFEGHEQLVLGGRYVWFGDSLRRDPLQRDAYESFSAEDRVTAQLARSTFERLWQLTLPLSSYAMAPRRLHAVTATCGLTDPVV